MFVSCLGATPPRQFRRREGKGKKSAPEDLKGPSHLLLVAPFGAIALTPQHAHSRLTIIPLGYSIPFLSFS